MYLKYIFKCLVLELSYFISYQFNIYINEKGEVSVMWT